MTNVRSFAVPLYLDYVYRRHDNEVDEILRSVRRGNYLIVGSPGAGKSACLNAHSICLHFNGLRHRFYSRADDTISFPDHGDFASGPINLIDDIEVALQTGGICAGLGETLKRKDSLNILTSRPVGAEAILEYLPIDGTIRIPDVLLDYESEGIIFQRAIKYHRENDIPGLNSGYALRFLELTSGVTYSTPGQVCDLFHNLASDRLRFTLDKDWSTRLRSIAPSVIRLSDNLLNLISRDPSAIWNLSPAEFEKLIGELFERDGYSVSFTKKSRDGGIDLFASKRDVAGEHLTIVQCKRYAAHNPVRVGIVREVIGSMNVKNATAAAIFTTSRFTRDAVEESRKIKYRLSLHDYFDIMKNISSSPGDC